MTGVTPETPALRTTPVRALGAALLVVCVVALALDATRISPLAEACFDAYQRVSPRPVWPNRQLLVPLTLLLALAAGLGAAYVAH